MKKKNFIIGLSILVLIYLAGVFIFSLRIYPRTFVGPVDIGWQTKDNAYHKDLKNFKLTLESKEGQNIEIPAEQVNYTSKLPADFKITQNAWTWPISIFRKHVLPTEYQVNYDKEKLESILDSSEIVKKAKPPKDARVEFVDGTYKILPEEEGTALDRKKLLPAIEKAFNEENNHLKLEDYYQKPGILQDDPKLVQMRDQLNEIAKVQITLDLGYKKYELKGQTLLNLYDKEGTVLTLNQERLREYIRNIAIETDTFGIDRQFKTTGRGIVTVKGGIYGWQMNVNKTRDEVLALLKNKESKTIEPVYLNKGLTRAEGDDIGNTYIEIDLTRQHMWFYKNGQLVVDTDVVTGDPTKNHPTPTGTDKIWSRETDRELKGLNFGGSSEYRVHVDYWMPVNWDGVGIHDTSYRKEYGGQIYKGNGSHGCINTPLEKVKTIFENVSNNTPVVIYQS